MACFKPKSPLGQLLAARRDVVLAVAARRHATNVRVFGSVARGTDGESSDIDLLVDMDPAATPMDLLSLGCDLEDALGVKVDVGTPGALRPAIRERVLAEAISL